MSRVRTNMLQGPLLPSIISFAIPLALSSALQLLFNAADLVVVGQFRGSDALAAVGATSVLTNLVVNLFIGLSVGVSVVVAHSIGSGETSATHRAVHTALPTAIFSGVTLALIGVVFSDLFLSWMDTPESILPKAALYMRLYFCGMPFNMVYNYSAAILRAMGESKKPMYYLTLAGIVNVVLNVIFVTLLQMDVDGVAIATVISQGISAILVVRALIRRTDAGKLELRKMRFYKKELLKIIRIGLPSGIQGILFNISNVLSQSSINSFGEFAISGVAAARNVEGFIKVVPAAFYHACMNFTGQNAGAHQYKRLLKVFGLCLLCSFSVTLCLSILMYAFGPTLLGIYIPDSQEAILSGMMHFATIGLFYCICGLLDVSTGVLRGLGVSFLPMLMSILGICVFRIVWIMTVFQIPAYHTLEHLFIVYPISWAVTFLAQAMTFFIIYRKRIGKDVHRLGT